LISPSERQLYCATIDEEELVYVQECLEAHIENPDDGMNLEKFKQYFAEKYGR
jgi:hypothetical protein